jgi:hypothetical protein
MNTVDLSADERLFDEMVSYRKNVTGVDNTVFISPRGMTRHSSRIKMAISLFGYARAAASVALAAT